MWHKPCWTFHPWCPCIMTHCLLFIWSRDNCLVIVMSSAIDCDIISRTITEWVRHWNDVKKSSFLSWFMDSLCCVRNRIIYVLLWWTVSALTGVLFWYLFPSLLRDSGNKHQNNPLVSAKTVRHSSTYIILYFLEKSDLDLMGPYCIKDLIG